MKLQTGVIIAILFSILVAIFAIMNYEPVLLNYFFGQVEICAVLIILGSAAAGAIIVAMLNLVIQIKLRMEIRELANLSGKQKSEISELEKENNELYQEVKDLSAEIERLKMGDVDEVESEEVATEGDV